MNEKKEREENNKMNNKKEGENNRKNLKIE